MILAVLEECVESLNATLARKLNACVVRHVAGIHQGESCTCKRQKSPSGPINAPNEGSPYYRSYIREGCRATRNVSLSVFFHGSG